MNKTLLFALLFLLVGTYQLNAQNLVINEIMYNPAESGTDSTEFIEIYNNGSTSVDMTNFTLTGGIYTFPSVSIPAGGYYVVCVNAGAFLNVYGMAADGVFTNALANGGESIVLKDNLGNVIDSVFYRNIAPWPVGTAVGTSNGGGASLILCDVNTDNNDGANWKAETTSVGVTINARPVLASPSAANVCPAPADIEATSFSGVNATYCNVPAVSGAIILSNVGGSASNKVYYTITANGFPILYDSVATIAAMGNVNIPVGPIPASTGVVNLVLTATSAGDLNAANNSISMIVSVSNTEVSAAVTSPVLCNGDANGSITATATNGLANPYTYVWSTNVGGQTSATVTGLAAGVYSVTATDSIACSNVTTITLTEPSLLSSSATITDVSCNSGNDGQIVAVAFGGTAPYNFLWDNTETTSTITGLSAFPTGIGCTITDINGCIATETITVTEPSPFSANLDTVINVLCFGEATGGVMITLSGATPPYTYLWNTGQTTLNLSNVMAGVYTGTTTDINGCTTSSTITITEPSMALTASAMDNGDGTATAMGTGGTPTYTYMWDNNSGNQTTAMATGLMSNTAYAVTVVDANGCTDSTLITVIFNNVEHLNNGINLQLYPNPTSGNVFVELDLASVQDVEITVLNTVGQITISKSLTNVQSQKVELETANLVSGIYLIQLNIGSEQVTRKLIIGK